MNIKALEQAFNLKTGSPMDPRRTFVGAAVKGIDAEKRQIRAYASTKAWDRYGERFEADAFKEGLDNFKKNPVILFAHDYSQAPIGKAIGYEFDANGLILTMQFADTEEAKKVFSLYEGGFMSAFSVGFRPLEYRFEERVAGSGEMGAVFVKAELLENSAVPVPANPEAVVIKGISGKTMTIPGSELFEILAKGYAVKSSRLEEEYILAVVRNRSGIDSGEIDYSIRSDRFERQDAFSLLEIAKTLDALKVKVAEQIAKVGGSLVIKTDPVPAADLPPANLKAALGYLISLGKATQGKVTDAAVRSLLIQANNVCRELVYGKSVESLDGLEASEVTPEEIAALVREYEVLSEQIAKGGKVTPKDIEDFKRLGDDIEKMIKGEKI